MGLSTDVVFWSKKLMWTISVLPPRLRLVTLVDKKVTFPRRAHKVPLAVKLVDLAVLLVANATDVVNQVTLYVYPLT